MKMSFSYRLSWRVSVTTRSEYSAIRESTRIVLELTPLTESIAQCPVAVRQHIKPSTNVEDSPRRFQSFVLLRIKTKRLAKPLRAGTQTLVDFRRTDRGAATTSARPELSPMPGPRR